ncbi:MAG: hypothetical protein K2R98_01225 [Gemmataceae bacterium]|nr:hypothetical protein [Gemmataceae bacterium]
MATTLKDFLQQEAEKQRAEASSAKAVIEEWRVSIERLFAQMRAWLKESDPNGVIEIEESQEVVNEPGLGRYRVPRLDLHALGDWIAIIPKARRTIGKATPPQKTVPERATGRVDITNEVHRYVLYRFQDNGRELWMINDLQSESKLLDQAAFENALMSYLR